MDWYKNMTDNQKKDFNKVLIVCASGTVLILLMPMLSKLIF